MTAAKTRRVPAAWLGRPLVYFDDGPRGRWWMFTAGWRAEYEAARRLGRTAADSVPLS